MQGLQGSTCLYFPSATNQLAIILYVTRCINKVQCPPGLAQHNSSHGYSRS